MSLTLTDGALKEAYLAVRHAQDVRAYHGRRTEKGTPQREADLKRARERLRKAMIPLRAYLGSMSHVPYAQKDHALAARIKQASNNIQSERRKIWKMQKRKKRRR